MTKTYTYEPLKFFLITFLISWIPWFFAIYASWYPSMHHLLLPLFLGGLSGPAISALIMVATSGNSEVRKDFFQRLRFDSIKRKFIPIIVLLFPVLFLTAIIVSLFFGQPVTQLSFITQSSDLLLQGVRFLMTLFVLFLIGPFEEIGWRGYGIDSLSKKCNLMTASLMFGAIWSLWHVPLFFIKNGGLQQEIWNVGLLQTFSYFTGLFLITIITNWLYAKNNRSILSAILFHTIYDTCFSIFHITPFTWFILWLFILLTSVIIVQRNKVIFFHPL